MNKIKTFSLDVEKGMLLVNGKEIKNVTAFSLMFKDGEYGLSVSHDDIYASNVENSRFFYRFLIPRNTGCKHHQ